MGGNESVAITAGLPGFLVLFLLALACWFLFRDMSKRMRNVRKLAEEEDRQEQDAARATADTPRASGDSAAPAAGQSDDQTDDQAGKRHTTPDDRN